MNNELKNWEDIKSNLGTEIKDNSFVYVVLTDTLFILSMDDSKLDALNVDKLLELRVFNEKGEYRLIRPDIGQNFRIRCIIDNKLEEQNQPISYFDKDLYLDISKVNGCMVSSANGGEYELPSGKLNIGEGMMLTIRNYLSYNDQGKNADGQARISDWRIVGFKEEVD